MWDVGFDQGSHTRQDLMSILSDKEENNKHMISHNKDVQNRDEVTKYENRLLPGSP
jgi:hypothetical protein